MSGSNEEKTLRLRSTVRQIYGGRLLMPGDRFPAPVPEQVARKLIKHQFATEDEHQGTLRLPRRAQSQHESDDDSPSEQKSRPQTARRSSYSRKDQEAEE